MPLYRAQALSEYEPLKALLSPARAKAVSLYGAQALSEYEPLKALLSPVRAKSDPINMNYFFKAFCKVLLETPIIFATSSHEYPALSLARAMAILDEVIFVVVFGNANSFT